VTDGDGSSSPEERPRRRSLPAQEHRLKHGEGLITSLDRLYPTEFVQIEDFTYLVVDLVERERYEYQLTLRYAGPLYAEPLSETEPDDGYAAPAYRDEANW
jgi:hypothetical protein